MWLLIWLGCSLPIENPLDPCEVGVRPGDCAPDFTVSTRSGEPVALSDFAGHVVLLDFSALWCFNCRDMAGQLQEIYAPRADYGFVVLTVLVEGMEHDAATPEDASAWAEEFGLTHPVVADGTRATDPLYAPLEGIPASWLIDGDGVIQHAGRGVLNHEDLANRIDWVMLDR